MDPEEGSGYLRSGSKSSGEVSDPGDNPSTSTFAFPYPTLPSHKRRHPAASPSNPPSKRQKGPFNARYLSLLNSEISNATPGSQFSSSPNPQPPSSPPSSPPLEPSQLGAIPWTSTEKTAFFTALSRLGRDNASAIASRIGSKSVLEVQQYQSLLSAAARARDSDAGKRVRMAQAPDIPAAAELSTELNLALERAADGIAERQEAHEQAVEQARWGAGLWLVTGPIARILELRFRDAATRRSASVSDSAPNLRSNPDPDARPGSGDIETETASDPLPPFAELFHLRNWLWLSERVFMNSTVVPDGNWRSVSGGVGMSGEENDTPSIRATALADFHLLAVSVTRRLVCATLFVAGSRVRAKQGGSSGGRGRRIRTKAVVKARDVQAALASVGMKENSREFWAKAARRLRLDVYDNDDDDEGEGESEDEDGQWEGGESHTAAAEYGAVLGEGEEETDIDIDTVSEHNDSQEEEDDINDEHISDTASEPNTMSYDEVEAALGFPNPNHHPPSHNSQSPQSLESPYDISSSSTAEFSDTEAEQEATLIKPSDESDADDTEIDTESVARDLHEATTYAALPYTYVGTTRGRQALRLRIQAEHQLEAAADRVDAQVGAREEARLWGLLRGDKDKDKGEEGGGLRREMEEMADEYEDRKASMPALKPKLSARKSGLEDLGGGDWRDHTTYYSEWEFAQGDRTT
ncbi:hypothetical protein GGR54DRAFT_647595 [Hypoxylon sp. NC1633]|nr:hypothetical protein GGR54DRAFT_647595 [Hypoxylon sp. NC1633]